MNRRRLLLPLLLLALAAATSPADAAGDAAEGGGARLLAKLSARTGTDLRFSRDGELLFTAGNDEIRVWDAGTLKPRCDPLRHKHLWALRLPDVGRNFLTAGDDVRVWDAGSGRQVGEPITVPEVRSEELEQAQNVAVVSGDCWDVAPMPCAISHDGKRIAVTRIARSDGRPARWDVEVWDVEPRRVAFSLRHDLRPQWVAFSPDGERLVTAAPVDHRPHGGGEVFRLWDLSTGNEVAPPISTKYNYSFVDAAPAVFSPDGSRLLLGDLYTFSVCDGQTGVTIAEGGDPGARGRGISVGDLITLAFSRDGRRVVSQNGPDFRVWETAGWKPLTEWRRGNAAISGDGGRVAACDYDLELKSNVVSVRDVDNGNELARMRMGQDLTFALRPHGRRVACALEKGVVGVWELPEREAK